MKRVNPCDSRVRMDLSHNTDDVTCSTSRAEISDGVPCACAVTLEITDTDGGETFTFASSACNFSCALVMSDE